MLYIYLLFLFPSKVFSVIVAWVIWIFSSISCSDKTSFSIMVAILVSYFRTLVRHLIRPRLISLVLMADVGRMESLSYLFLRDFYRIFKVLSMVVRRKLHFPVFLQVISYRSSVLNVFHCFSYDILQGICWTLVLQSLLICQLKHFGTCMPLGNNCEFWQDLVEIIGVVCFGLLWLALAACEKSIKWTVSLSPKLDDM